MVGENIVYCILHVNIYEKSCIHLNHFRQILRSQGLVRRSLAIDEL